MKKLFILSYIFFMVSTSHIFSQAPPQEILNQLGSAINYFESDDFNGSYNVESYFSITDKKKLIENFTTLEITKKTGEEAITKILETRTIGGEEEDSDDEDDDDLSIRVPAGADLKYYSFAKIKYNGNSATTQYDIKKGVSKKVKNELGSGYISWDITNNTLKEINFVPLKQPKMVTKSSTFIEFKDKNGFLYPETTISQGEIKFLLIREEYYSKLFCYNIVQN